MKDRQWCAWIGNLSSCRLHMECDVAENGEIRAHPGQEMFDRNQVLILETKGGGHTARAHLHRQMIATCTDIAIGPRASLP